MHKGHQLAWENVVCLLPCGLSYATLTIDQGGIALQLICGHITLLATFESMY